LLSPVDRAAEKFLRARNASAWRSVIKVLGACLARSQSRLRTRFAAARFPRTLAA